MPICSAWSARTVAERWVVPSVRRRAVKPARPALAGVSFSLPPRTTTPAVKTGSAWSSSM